MGPPKRTGVPAARAITGRAAALTASKDRRVRNLVTCKRPEFVGIMARIHSTPLLRPRAGTALYWIYGVLQMAGVIALTAWFWGRWMEAITVVLLTRAIVAGGVMWAYLAVSMDETSEVAFAALDTSRHVLWLPAGLLLLSTLTPLGTIAGLALLANATRLLVSARAPH